MRKRRTPRISAAEVDRLAAGEPSAPDHRGLAALLDAARSPATPGELAGEQAAVDRFVAAYRDAVPTSLPRERRRVRIPLSARTVAVKVAAGAAVLAVGGTAIAAETGNLPSGVQQQAHDMFSVLGVPAPHLASPPTGRAEPTVSGEPSASPTGPAGPAPGSPAPGHASPGAPALPSSALRGLCEAWAAQQEPAGKAMPAASRRSLSDAAGGAERIPRFCARLAASPETGNPGTGPGRTDIDQGGDPPVATPSHPGNGTGDGPPAAGSSE